MEKTIEQLEREIELLEAENAQLHTTIAQYRDEPPNDVDKVIRKCHLIIDLANIPGNKGQQVYSLTERLKLLVGEFNRIKK